MQIQSFLSSRRTLCGVEGGSKKRALELIANLIAEDIPTLNSDEIFLSFIAREKLGSTGLGSGIAIPHCRIKNCIGTIGAVIKLNSPVDFDSIDGRPVDIVFALIAPEQAHEEHLQTLAALADKLLSASYIEQLRDANSSDELFYAAISEKSSSHA